MYFAPAMIRSAVFLVLMSCTNVSADERFQYDQIELGIGDIRVALEANSGWLIEPVLNETRRDLVDKYAISDNAIAIIHHTLDEFVLAEISFKQFPASVSVTEMLNSMLEHFSKQETTQLISTSNGVSIQQHFQDGTKMHSFITGGRGVKSVYLFDVSIHWDDNSTIMNTSREIEPPVQLDVTVTER
ncbi:MAG: hypothetical protein ACN6I5_01475 [Hyphomicrobiales bacterium]